MIIAADTALAAELIGPEPWKRSTVPDVAQTVAVMREHGMPADLIERCLGRVIGAMRAEYGE